MAFSSWNIHGQHGSDDCHRVCCEAGRRTQGSREHILGVHRIYAIIGILSVRYPRCTTSRRRAYPLAQAHVRKAERHLRQKALFTLRLCDLCAGMYRMRKRTVHGRAHSRASAGWRWRRRNVNDCVHHHVGCDRPALERYMARLVDIEHPYYPSN